MKPDAEEQFFNGEIPDEQLRIATLEEVQDLPNVADKGCGWLAGLLPPSDSASTVCKLCSVSCFRLASERPIAYVYMDHRKLDSIWT